MIRLGYNQGGCEARGGWTGESRIQGDGFRLRSSEVTVNGTKCCNPGMEYREASPQDKGLWNPLLTSLRASENSLRNQAKCHRSLEQRSLGDKSQVCQNATKRSSTQGM